MNEATLRGCRDKADRADQLTQQVHTVWEAFLRTHPYPWWVEQDLVTGCYRVFYDFSEPPPVRLAVITGEWVHNLRSALDHLAWQEALEFVGPRVTEKRASSIFFPLTRRSADFRSRPVRRFVSKDAWALMERHQPYKRGKGYAPKTLGYLHWLSIEDKHRALTYQGTMGPMFGQHFRVEWEGGPSEPLRVEHPFRAGAGKPVKGEAEVLRLYFPPGLDLRVWVQRDPDFTVGLGRVPRRFRPARLGLASQFVRAIIDDFAVLVP